MSINQQKRTGQQCVLVTLSELLQLSKVSAKLSLSALRIKSSQAGFHLSRLLGRGMEFAESRRYQTGDDIRNMDWRVTARTGKAHTKLFAAEKERQVILLADMRSSMFFATQGVFKSVQAALVLSHIAWNTSQSGNRLGGTIFNETHHVEFRPALGKRGLLPFLQKLAESTIQADKSGQANSEAAFEKAIANTERVATPGSLVFIVSDFRHLSTASSNRLMKIARHSDLVLCLIYDKWESELPQKGRFNVTNGTQEININTYDKQNLEKYQNQFLERKNKVKQLADQRHVHFIECGTNEDCFTILSENFGK